MENTVYQRIAAKIKVLLDYKNMSYQNMGQAIGWGKAAVGHWVRMERTPPNDALAKMADYVGISRDYFFKEFNSHGEVYGTAEVGEGISIDEIYYAEAMADLVRELEKVLKIKKR